MQSPFEVLIPLYTSIASRLHGGGIVSNVPRQLRNFVYALPYFVINYINHSFHTDSLGVSGLSFLGAFLGINLGHEAFWNMGYLQPAPRGGALEKIVGIFPLTFGSTAYCIVGMALKGFIIGAGTLNIYVIISHTIAWPVSYWIGMRTFRLNNVFAEFMSGWIAGCSLILLGV